jgi:hypothetical protein
MSLQSLANQPSKWLPVAKRKMRQAGMLAQLFAFNR